ncbi:MAG: transposase [Zoogloea sp.]|nr:transposase [Zoogloea sp.]
MFIDSTIERAHQHAAGAPRKRLPSARPISWGGLSAKINALVEGLGSLARFALTGGQAGDSPKALPLIEGLQPHSVSADKACDTDTVLEYLATYQVEAVIPLRSHRKVQRAFDRYQYKSRNFVERYFYRIK